jgi:hypothetical protein
MILNQSYFFLGLIFKDLRSKEKDLKIDLI